MNDQTRDTSASRADLHCHSTASAISRLGVQRSLGLPECATPPEEVYELAKRRGMDFVTITDHDTIDGAVAIAERHDDAFVSEELTVWFRGEPQAVHVLVYGITPDDHEWLQRHRTDVEACAEYLHGNGVACALAHPFYAVAAPLTARHRRRLAELFGVWETRNGARARELNAPAAVYVETHGGTGIGGSDDHAGVDVGRTWTETPPAPTWREFLAHVRAGSAEAAGDHGSAAKWAHAAMAIAVRTLGAEAAAESDPSVVLRMVERVMREGNVRAGATGADLAPDDARNLLRAWLDATGVGMTGDELLAWMQSDGFSHGDLFRIARRRHERALGGAVDDVVTLAQHDMNPALAAPALFRACVAAIPYAPAAAFLGREKGRLAARDAREPLRVALVADGIGGMHGVTHTLEEIQARGVPGFEVEVVGTDANVDRRLPAVREVEIPFYAGLEVGVPSLPGIVETLAEGRYDLVHLVSPGPCGVAAAVIARVMELPVLGSYHTELAAYARLRSGDGALGRTVTRAVAAFYGGCHRVLSPSPAADAVLRELGIAPQRIGRWDRGVDAARFSPDNRVEGLLRGEVNVLYAGRLTHEKGVDLLAQAFLAARQRDPRLHLSLAGGGPEEDRLREKLGEHATFLGWLEAEDLASAYASADVLLFCSRTDTFGQVLLEAQASGLPVVAVAEGGPCSIVTDDVTGLLRPADAGALAQAVTDLARLPFQRARLARNALAAVRERTWEAALGRLAAGYRACAATAAGADSAHADVRG
ncbi:MAG TPA: glycosyltransferase, partial [Solirubrobacteraceae bacterium]|nr:glycosyltransferase [Solirubrobacteraceae bacterium]